MDFIFIPLILFLIATALHNPYQRVNELDKQITDLTKLIHAIEADHYIHEFNWKPIGNKVRTAEKTISVHEQQIGYVMDQLNMIKSDLQLFVGRSNANRQAELLNEIFTRLNTAEQQIDALREEDLKTLQDAELLTTIRNTLS